MGNNQFGMREWNEKDQTFTFGLYRVDERQGHKVKDLNCAAGRCGDKESFLGNLGPITCQCGGVIHVNADLSWMDDPYWSPEFACDNPECQFDPYALSEEHDAEH